MLDLKPKIRVMTQAQIDKVHQDALSILKETGRSPRHFTSGWSAVTERIGEKSDPVTIRPGRPMDS